MASIKIEDALTKINNLLQESLFAIEQIEDEHPDLKEFTDNLNELADEFARIADEM